MSLTRRHFTALVAAATLPGAGIAQGIDLADMLDDLMSGDPGKFVPALDAIKARGNPDMAAALIKTMRFSSAPSKLIVEALEGVTGVETGDRWFDWMLWQEANPQIKPHPSFIDFKRAMLLRVDPNFDVFLQRKYLQPERMRIRLEEVTWGGVRKDGIPSLDNPQLITAKEARYLRKDDLVFGVSINGDARAYPLRIMGWHEMFNEVIGGVPVALAYCTLCGSGILFETKVAGRAKPFVFGSSGFLYRSNKLMFDRQTHSLWNQFTGKPVIGPLAAEKITLTQRPVVITTWDEWRAQNPETRALSLQTGHRRDYSPGAVYNEYFSSADLMFPTLVDERRHKQKSYVFGIRSFGGAKAWPLRAFRRKRVINDALSGQNLVLIGNAKTRSVRAYERGDLTFRMRNGFLTGSDGKIWTSTEDALVSGERTLPRVAGHIAYWFAWNGYLGAESALYEG